MSIQKYLELVQVIAGLIDGVDIKSDKKKRLGMVFFWTNSKTISSISKDVSCTNQGLYGIYSSILSKILWPQPGIKVQVVIRVNLFPVYVKVVPLS